MKKIVLYIYFLTFLLSTACSQQNIEQGKIYEHLTIKTDTALSYAIYIPTGNTLEQPLAFIFFDPHGNGNLPINLYKNIADEFGIILIGNNNSSNETDFNLIASNFSILLNEIKSTYKINEKDIALWGFSGGAKAAIYNTGLNNNIAYCIYGGSVMNLQNSNIELLGFNGKQDMNYTDLLGFALQQQNNSKHFQIEFQGKHAWPDTLTSKDAFRWFLLEKMQKKEIPINKNIITKSFNAFKKQVDSLVLSKQYTDAFLACEKSVHFLKSLTDITYFNTKKSFISSQSKFKTEVQYLHENFEKEMKIKVQYQTDFFAKDTTFWKKEIADLWLKAATDQSGIYNRLLGFLSLASYSYANRAFRENNIQSLEQVLFIYHYSDPTNPEQAYMRAQLYAQQNKTDLAKSAIQEAINLGIDKTRFTNNALFRKL